MLSKFDLPAEFKNELAGFCKGLILQFAVIKKHVVDFDLRAVKFERFAWASWDALRCEIMDDGKRLLPRDISLVWRLLTARGWQCQPLELFETEKLTLRRMLQRGTRRGGKAIIAWGVLEKMALDENPLHDVALSHRPR